MEETKLKRFFWDVDFAQLDQNKDADFIIARLLEIGDEEATQWLFSVYNRDNIAEVLKNSTKISSKSANYWGIILDVPRDKVRCLSKQYQNKPEVIWKY